MLYKTDQKAVPLKEELKVINDYIELQKLRLTPKVDVSYKVIGKPDNYKIEPLLLIPLIENSFKYGTDSVNESYIDISIQIFNDNLSFIAKNSIVQKHSKNVSESGLGIKNVKRRLDLLYPNEYNFITDKDENSFLVKLQIKLRK